jgi:hypothetical protein
MMQEPNAVNYAGNVWGETMYLWLLYTSKWLQVLLWPRWCVYKHGYMPPDGEAKGKVLEYWLTPLFEVRIFAK